MWAASTASGDKTGKEFPLDEISIRSERSGRSVRSPLDDDDDDEEDEAFGGNAKGKAGGAEAEDA